MAAPLIPSAPDQVLGAAHQADHPEPRVTTVLVCDNALLRIGLQDILRETPFAPAVTTSTADLTLVQGAASETALVLIESSQNISRLLEVVRRVREQTPKVRIVALANQFNPSFVRLGHQVGVDGFCSVDSAPAVLIKLLELIMLGESVLPFAVLHSITDGAFEYPKRSSHDRMLEEPKSSVLLDCRLSPLDVEILRGLRQGAPNKSIAHKLNVTETTIKVHVKAILRKIGASNRTQAAMWAATHLSRRV